MLEENRKILERFVERAEELISLSYFNTRGGFDILGPKEVEFYQPEDEQLFSLVLLLRQFMQKQDVIAIENLSALLDDPGISVAWKEEYKRTTDLLNEYLNFEAVENKEGETISNMKFFNAYTYGKISHTYKNERDARKLFLKWIGEEKHNPVAYNLYHSILRNISIAINNISLISKRELKENSPKR